MRSVPVQPEVQPTLLSRGVQWVPQSTAPGAEPGPQQRLGLRGRTLDAGEGHPPSLGNPEERDAQQLVPSMASTSANGSQELGVGGGQPQDWGCLGPKLSPRESSGPQQGTWCKAPRCRNCRERRGHVQGPDSPRRPTSCRQWGAMRGGRKQNTFQGK